MKPPQEIAGSNKPQYVHIESNENPTQRHILITVPQQFVKAVYEQALIAQQLQAKPYGLPQKEAALSYVENVFHSHIQEQINEFLLKFFVLNLLYKELRTQCLPIAGTPRLLSIETNDNKEMVYKFATTYFTIDEFLEWKYFAFKSPKRKQYQDLDKQVKVFIDEEEHNKENYKDKEISYNDWINFDVFLVDCDHNVLLDGYAENLWLRIGNEESDVEFQDLFIGKKTGDRFYTDNEGLQDFFNELTGSHFTFLIEIKDIVPNAYVNIEYLKKQFKIKTNKDLHQKLIEVFSYRNDISQRKATIDESLKLMFTKHPFTAPHFLVLRQLEELLCAVQSNPDYLVYKMQKDFKKNLEILAETQVKEFILADQVAYHEHIDVTHEDVKSYLNLTNRQRLREFLHFKLPSPKVRGQELPLITQELMQTCLREKTLNFIIYHFTKK